MILALGLGPPSQLPGISPDVLSARTYIANPWRGDLADLPDGDILLLGSGLTMVDVALVLDRPGRNLLALSRHGLLPRPHAAAPQVAPPEGPWDTPRQAVATVRAHARDVGWRSAVDSIRGVTPTIWRKWSDVERRRFLRHLQPWWEVHRHRIALAVAQRLSEPMWAERFSLVAGRLVVLDPAETGFEARIRLRAQALPFTRRFAAVVNCTGLSGDLRSSELLAQLQAQGLARPDAFRLGLEVDDGCGLIGGRWLCGRGPLRRRSAHPGQPLGSRGRTGPAQPDGVRGENGPKGVGRPLGSATGVADRRGSDINRMTGPCTGALST